MLVSDPHIEFFPRSVFESWCPSAWEVIDLVHEGLRLLRSWAVEFVYDDSVNTANCSLSLWACLVQSLSWLQASSSLPNMLLSSQSALRADALAATRLREAQLDLREARILMRQKLTETEAELMAARRKAADDETFALNAQEALKEMSRKVKEVGELKMKLQSSLERMKHRIRELKHEKHIMKCAVKSFATAYVGAGKHKDAVVKTFADAFTSM